MYDCRENEHQELFYLGVDPRKPIAIHIPSPLGWLGYFVYLRVPAPHAPRLAAVSVKADVLGLRDSHVVLAPGEGAPATADVPSRHPGLAWRCFGRPALARGDGTLTLQNWPADIPTADLLLCTWPRFIESGMADAWIAAQADPLWAPSGVPLGGIGGGRVDICRDGRFRNFSMNNNQDAPVEDPDGLPGAYLAVTCGAATRELASRPIVSGHEPARRLEFEPRFPQAALRAPSLFQGLDVAVTLSGTLCPHDLKRSSLPGFLVRWEVTNRGKAPRTVTCRMGWPNLVGIGGRVAEAESGIGYGDGYYRQWDDPTGRQEFAIETGTCSSVRYKGRPREEFLSSAGEHILAVARESGMTAVARCDEGRGEVTAEITVEPGTTASATMAVAAAMPHWIDSLKVDRGAFWQNHFADAHAMADFLIAEADAILRDAGALAQLLDEGKLPAWLRARLNNCCYPLVTNSVFYRDGRFSINEGPTEMAGCYGTIDQRLAAHPATQLLFPQLNATELGLFGAVQGPTGGINHDLGGGNLERGPGEQAWPDLPCSFIIQTARHAWSTGDAAFAAAAWPRARRALLRHAKWAEEGRGVAQVGEGLGTSYDGYHYVGTTGYMATLWLAALAVAEKWATREGDAELLGLIPGWRDAALRRLNADLWNGRHFIAYGNSAGLRRDTCHAGQLAGQAFARLLTGTDVLPDDRLRSCVDALLAMNGSDRFAVPPDEVAPDGSAATAFGWLPYVEGFMLTAVASLGDARLWPLWERMIKVVDGDYAHPCDTRLMYRPLRGEPSWGAYYMTAPASWLVYDAMLDFFYEPAEGSLRLRTSTPGRFPLVHPLFWAVADIGRSGNVTLTVRRVFAGSPPALAALDVPGSTARVTMARRKLTAEPGPGVYRRFRLPQPVALAEGTAIQWRVYG